MKSEGKAVRRSEALTGLQLLGCVAAILVLALAAPAAFAVAVNRARVARANADVQAIAEAIAGLAGQTGSPLVAPPGQTANSNGLLDLFVGPGNVPRQGDGNQWIAGRTSALAERLGGRSRLRLELGSDPWGNRYTVNIGALHAAMAAAAARTGTAIWVMSAGPNGIIETPFVQNGERATLGGDDIGARVR